MVFYAHKTQRIMMQTYFLALDHEKNAKKKLQKSSLKPVVSNLLNLVDHQSEISDVVDYTFYSKFNQLFDS